MLQPAKLAVTKPSRTRFRIGHQPRRYALQTASHPAVYLLLPTRPQSSHCICSPVIHTKPWKETGLLPFHPLTCLTSHLRQRPSSFAPPVTNLTLVVRTPLGFCIFAPSDLTLCAANSRDRHFRYCGRHTRNRPRSCRACNAAKTKCSFEGPCSRCTKRGIECVYGDSVAAGRRTLPRSAAAHTVTVGPCKRPSTSLDFETSNADDGILPNGASAFANNLDVNGAQVQFINGYKHQSVDLITQRSPLREFLNFDELFAFEDDTSTPYQCSPDVSLALYDNPDQRSGSWCAWSRGNVPLSVMTENPSLKSNSNLLAVLQSGRPHAQHNADLIIQSLRSFPTMMLRRETFPWFIHPHSQLLSESTGTALPEALSNCMSIAQMFASRTAETKYFIRQTIGAEYRRFISDVRFPFFAHAVLLQR